MVLLFSLDNLRTFEDVLAGEMDNASESEIDRDVKLFTKAAKVLHSTLSSAVYVPIDYFDVDSVLRLGFARIGGVSKYALDVYQLGEVRFVYDRNFTALMFAGSFFAERFLKLLQESEKFYIYR